MGENLAKLVVRDLTDESAFRPQRRQTRQRVRRRAAGNLPRRAHGFVKLMRPSGIHQRHPAPRHAQPFYQRVIARGHDIDDGVADGDDVGSGLGHIRASPAGVSGE